MSIDHEGELSSLLERIAALEQERDELMFSSKKVAEANARAALHMAERNRKLEQQGQSLREAVERAEQASRRKEEFLAKVSHELRTPLNGIMGMTTFLLNTELDEEQQDFAATVKDSADSLLTIINELLDFSSLSAGKLRLVHECFDLWMMVEGVLLLLSARARSKGLDLSLNVQSTVPRHLMGDCGRLRQILVNLCGNAIKFTEAGSVRIAVCLSEDQSEVWLSVEDTGLGIENSALSKIFEAFSQVDDSASRAHGGSGLGLSISRELVTVMGGRIEVASQVGAGSRFTVKLPLADSLPARAPSDNDAAAFDSCDLYIGQESSRALVEDHLDALGLRVQRHQSWSELVADSSASIDRHRHLVLVALEDLDDAERHQLARLSREDPAFSNVVLILPSRSEPVAELRSLRVLRNPLRVTELHRLVSGASRKQAPEVNCEHCIDQIDELAGLSVLLVEDNPLNKLVAERMLTRFGCSTTLAENGEVCLKLLSETAPDVVLMDCQMPVMDGYEATRRIRALSGSISRTPVIAFTAHASAADKVRCLETGMDDHLSKPIAPDRLAEVLIRWCHSERI